jgi:hypothetical protein
VAETNLNKYLRPQLEKVAIRYVRNLQASLDRGRANGRITDTGKLSKSIRSKVIIRSSADFEIQLSWEDYGDSLNFGADLGFLSKAGSKRLEEWVVHKLGKERFTRSRKGRRVNNARRIAFAIQNNWARGGRFPSTKSNSKGWASIALRSREIADTRKALEENLTTAYNKFIQDKLNALNKKNQRRR